LAWIWLVAVVSPLAEAPLASFTLAVPWGRFILLFAALRYWVLVKPEVLYKLGKILAMMLAFILLDTVWQYIYGVSLTGHARPESNRLTGPFDNVKVGIYCAKMFMPCTLILLYFAIEKGRHILTALLVSLLLATEVVIMLSGERTAFVSSIIGLGAATFLLALAERRVRIAAPFMAGIFAAIIFFLIKTQQWVYIRVMELINVLSAFGDSIYGRLFKAAYIIGSENWLHGAGLKGFRVLSEPLKNTVGPFCSENEFCNLHPHNSYLEWFAETGAVGLLLYCAMIVFMLVAIVRYFRANKGVRLMLPSMALGIVFINFFPLMVTQSVFSNWPAILLWYSVGVGFACLNLCEKPLEE
jgi:O-antigen ligase